MKRSRKKGDAIIPTSVLKNKNILILACGSFFLTFSSMAVFFMASYIIYVMGGTALQASLTSAAMFVLGIFIGPVFGRHIGKTGNARNLLIIGTIVRIIVTLAFIFLLSPTRPLWVIIVLMLIAGFYNSQQSVTFSTAQIQIPAELRAQGNSVIQFSQNLGSSAGMLVYTIVIGMGLEKGFPVALWVAAGVAVIVLFTSLFLKPLPKNAEAN